DPRVHPVVARLAAYGWRLLVIAAVVAAGVWLLRQLWVLFVALAVATFITRALDGPARWLRGRGARPALAAAAALLMFLGACALIGWTIVPRVADEFSTLGPTITEALDDVEDWLVEDSPFDLDRRDVNDLRGRI